MTEFLDNTRLNSTNLTSYDVDDWILKEFWLKHKNNSSYFRTYITNITNLYELQNKLKDLFEGVHQHWSIDSEGEFSYILDKDNSFLISVIKTYKNSHLNIHSPSEKTRDELYSKIEKVLSTDTHVPHITWYYRDGPAVKDINVNLNVNHLPCDEFYPFLKDKNQTLVEYYDSFKNSGSSVLVLIGPPGTGKTSFIKGYLNHTGCHAMTSSEPDVLYSDNMFINFITSKTNVFVVEDADKYLQPREDNNPIMHKVLNASDGLLSMPDTKKMIFSTNLPGTSSIDPALIRPGRCFEVLNFGELNSEYVTKIAEKFNIKDVPNKEGIVLADLMNSHKKNSHSGPSKRRVGFI